MNILVSKDSVALKGDQSAEASKTEKKTQNTLRLQSLRVT